jgi:hypothetical protein
MQLGVLQVLWLKHQQCPIVVVSIELWAVELVHEMEHLEGVEVLVAPAEKEVTFD